MRKVYSGLFVSMDGVAESPDQWQFDVFDQDMGEEMMTTLSQIDTILLGRVTYGEWANYWPNASVDQDFAAFINNAPKYVFSKTLDSVAWGSYDNISLLKGDLAPEIASIKAQPGSTIGVMGSPTLVRNLIEHDLLDELTLMIHPVVVNKGKKLFQDGNSLKRMNLTRSCITGSGVAILNYEPRR